MIGRTTWTATAVAALLAAAIPVTAAASLSVIRVTDSAIQLPAGGLKAGIDELRIVGSGTRLHHLVFWRLHAGVSYAQFDRVFASPNGALARLVTAAGGNGQVDPGGATDLYLDLAQGRYAITDLTDGPTNEVRVTIGPARSKIRPPRSVGTIRAVAGDRFRLPPGFGRPGVYTFRNEDDELHEASLVRMKPGKTAPDLVRFLKGGGKGAYPVAAELGGFGALGGHLHGWMVLPALPHGAYALVCFIPDEHGVPHVAMGMIAGFTR
jgi:hypothetical protein